MFEWFWNFLYSISEILFEVIDGVLAICNRLVGVEPISVGGKDVSFINVILGDNRVKIAFIGASLIGIFLLMIFSTIAICRNMKDGKKSNGEIVGQVFKTLGTFLIIPALMFGFSSLINVLVQLIFNATRGGSQSMGKFLFDAFRPAGMTNVEGYVDWRSVSSVRTHLGTFGYQLSDYRFFFSWLVCIPLLFLIARSLFLFVDRTLSIVILFIFSPISMSTSVLDDGARFKIWRDKILSKFISGYGMIIAINIYIIVLSFITRSDVVLFPGEGVIPVLCNFLLKCAFAIGGAFFLPKVFGLVADLFVNGGGTNEFREYDGSVNTIKQLIRDRKMDKREEQRKKEAEEARKNSKGAGGLARANPTLALASAAGGNQYTKKLSDTFDIGSKVANAIKNEPPQKNSNDDKSDISDEKFQGLFGISKEQYKKENSNNNVAGSDVVKNSVKNIVGGSSSSKGGK